MYVDFFVGHRWGDRDIPQDYCDYQSQIVWFFSIVHPDLSIVYLVPDAELDD